MLHLFSSLALAWHSAAQNPELHFMLASPWIILPVLALGASVGSFLNVVMIRVPRGESIVSPPSHCMSCGAAIPWYDNIPILSYLILRGRCRRCKAKFSPAYAVTEAITAVLALACFFHARTDAPWLHLSRFLAEFAFVSVLIVLAGIDAKTWILPNRIVLPAIPVFWSMAVLTHELTWSDALIGASAGFVVLALVILGYGLATGRMGMGWGDAKLMAALGAFLGWKALPLIILLGSFQGLLAAIVMLSMGKTSRPTEPYRPLSDEEPQAKEGSHDEGTGATKDDELAEQLSHPDSWRHTALPFGPFLALAAIETLFFQQRLLDLWLS